MNVIGHLATAQGAGSVEQLGAMLPDLFTLYHRRMKSAALLREVPAVERASPWWKALQRGVRFHVDVDRRFHEHPLFLRGYRGLRHLLERHLLERHPLERRLLEPCPLEHERLEHGRRMAPAVECPAGCAAGRIPGRAAVVAEEQTGGGSVRYGRRHGERPWRPLLTAHVLHELRIDRLLLRRSPQLARQFRERLAEHVCLLTRLARRSPHYEAQRFASFLGRLTDGDFLADFRAGFRTEFHPQFPSSADERREQRVQAWCPLVRRMERIQRRYGQRGFTATEVHLLCRQLEDTSADTEAELARFLDGFGYATLSSATLVGGTLSSGTSGVLVGEAS